MATRVMTAPQIQRVENALNCMTATLSSVGYPWPLEAQADIKAAYEALGLEPPLFQVIEVVEETEAEPEPIPQTAPGRPIEFPIAGARDDSEGLANPREDSHQ